MRCESSLDENDGSITDGDASLRDALALANDGDTITFATGAGEAFENGGTIRLSQDLGELVIASDVTIDGDLDDDGAPDVTVTGDTLGDDALTTDLLGNTITRASGFDNKQDNVRVFNVTSGSSTIDGLVITGGSPYKGDAGGIHIAQDAALSITHSSVSGNYVGRGQANYDGGGIVNAGTLALTHSVLFGNYAHDGGAIRNEGAAMLINTTVSDNHAYADGGGLENVGTLKLTDTAVLDNGTAAFGKGGGISNAGTATLTNTVVSNNYSGGHGRGGGGIHNAGTVTLNATTVATNSTGTGGGGIVNLGYATLNNTTVSGNSGYRGAGGISNGGTLTLTNVTVAKNEGGYLGGAGGIDNRGTATLTNATVSGNSAFHPGGGIGNGGTATLTNTIVVGNTAPTDPEISGAITETGPNIIGGSAADVFAFIDGTTGGGFLLDNGGAVQTIALNNDAANPALDAGQDDQLDESVAGIDLNGDGDTDDVIDTDARGGGFPRRVDLPGVANNGANTVDLGAFEVQVNAPFEVTTALDEAFDGGTLAEEMGDGDGLSLREALALANQVPDRQDTITFASGPGDAFETGGTIRLDQTLGELVLASDVTIDGDLNDDDAPDVTVTGDTLGDDVTATDPLGNAITDVFNNTNADDNVRVFDVTGGLSGIDGLVITGGAGDFGAGIRVADSATLTVTDSSISGNYAVYGGGGVENSGTATLTDTLVSANFAYIAGGVENGGTATLSNTLVSGNRSDETAGGIGNNGKAILSDTTVSGNSAYGSGGGIFNVGHATLTNVTVSDNDAGGFFASGGGIHNDGTAILTNTTVSGNFGFGSGGGILNRDGGDATLTNSIVLGNISAIDPLEPSFGPNEISGTITEAGPNIIGGNAADVFAETIDNNGVAAGLLADNGGAVQTIALKNDPSNPALDAGQDDRLDESVVGIDLNGDGDMDDVIDTDARGDRFGRFADLPDAANNGANTVDLGAFEVQVTATFEVTTALDEAFDGGTLAEEMGDGDGLSLREALALANQVPDRQDTITFASGSGEAFENGGIIRLSQALGELVLSSDLTIDGDLDDDGAPDVTITGDTLGDDATTTDPLGNAITDVDKNHDNSTDNVRVISVAGSLSTINGLVITGAFSGYGGRGVWVKEDAALTLTNSSVSGNGWSGIWNQGTATLADTTVSGNAGGGIFNDGTATLSNTTVSGNAGGGITNNAPGTATLTNTTVSGNTGVYGGGIGNSGTATLTNTTVSGNSLIDGPWPSLGGGIYNSGTATLINSIVLGNEDEIHEEGRWSTITEVGSNIIGGDARDVFAAIDPATGGGLLADSGGPVQTIALKPQPDNPALDAGQDDRLDESVAGIDLNGDGDTDDVIDTDARGDGFTRLVDLPGLANNGENTVDLGAFELDSLIANMAPVIVSAATSLVPPEYAWALDVETTDDFDAEGEGLTYAITGGVDAALFNLDAATGVLTFVSAPDFENPGDSNGDNDYEVQVTVTDSGGLSDVQDMVVTVSKEFSTFVVTTADDERDDLDGLGTVSLENFGGADDLSLREALALADEIPGQRDTITFASDPGEAFENGGAIRLSQDLGGLVIVSDVTIDGDIDDDGAPDVTVTGDTLGDDALTTDPLGNIITDAFENLNNDNSWDNVRVFDVLGGFAVLDGLVITGGKEDNWVFNEIARDAGAGVHVAEGARLVLSNSSVSGNHALSAGGIGNNGSLIVSETTISGNIGEAGAGIFNDRYATATVINTTVSSNIPSAGIKNSFHGTLTITNTTVSGNKAEWGGGSGINNDGTATLTNTTVSNNERGIENGGTLALANSIVLGRDGSEINGEITETGPNIVGGRAEEVFAAIDPATGGGRLADNGGAVQTIALKNDASNPALDAGQDDRLDESVVGIDLNGDGDTDDVIDTDARGEGFPRGVDLTDVANNGSNMVDLGAFEVPADGPGGPEHDLIPVTVTFKAADAWYSSAFGIYDRSTLTAELLAADIGETAEGAVLYEAALTQEQLDNLGFFLLPDGARWNADLASLVGEDLMVVHTAAGYAVSSDGMPLSGRDAPAFFSDASLNPGGIDHFVEDGTPAAYCLSVEDLAGGGDLDFDDALFLVETEVPMTGAEVTATFESESAFFHNTFGYFIEGNGEAEIIFADLDETTLPVGTMETFDLAADEYKNLKFFLIPDGADRNADLFSDLDALDLMVEEVNGALQARDVASDTVLEGFVNPIYVPEKDGNPDATRHALQTGDVDDFMLSWEDLPGVGDKDYNDTFIGVEITATDEVLV